MLIRAWPLALAARRRVVRVAAVAGASTGPACGLPGRRGRRLRPARARGVPRHGRAALTGPSRVASRHEHRRAERQVAAAQHPRLGRGQTPVSSRSTPRRHLRQPGGGRRAAPRAHPAPAARRRRPGRPRRSRRSTRSTSKPGELQRAPRAGAGCSGGGARPARRGRSRPTGRPAPRRSSRPPGTSTRASSATRRGLGLAVLEDVEGADHVEACASANGRARAEAQTPRPGDQPARVHVERDPVRGRRASRTRWARPRCRRPAPAGASRGGHPARRAAGRSGPRYHQ